MVGGINIQRDGKENARSVRTLVYRTFDSTDGRTFYKKPQIMEDSLDLCDDCLSKATNIQSIGVGCREFRIKNINYGSKTD